MVLWSNMIKCFVKEKLHGLKTKNFSKKPKKNCILMRKVFTWCIIVKSF